MPHSTTPGAGDGPAQTPEYRSRYPRTFLQRHGLGLAAVSLLSLWIVLYIPANPGTHAGGFFGNAIADWAGTVVTIYATKYLYEIGSAESRRPRGTATSTFRRLWLHHSLTLFLFVTGVIWVVVYVRMDSNSKWGQVVGNIVSEWTQVFGLVLLTKHLMEIRSKE